MAVDEGGVSPQPLLVEQSELETHDSSHADADYAHDHGSHEFNAARAGTPGSNRELL